MKTTSQNTLPPVDLLHALEHDGGQVAMLLAQPPIAFHRPFVSLTGSATAALLLSLCVELMNDPSKSDLSGWIMVSSEEMTERCGLSRKEQVTARERLRNLRLLEERRTGYPAQFEMRLNSDLLEQVLIALAQRPKAAAATAAPIFGTRYPSMSH